MSETPKSIQDGFVLPVEGPIADRQHRAYDVKVNQDTYDWLSQTPKSSRVSFVPLGNIPERATGYLTRGDGPKAVLDVQEGTRTRLPRVVGISSNRPSPAERDEAKQLMPPSPREVRGATSNTETISRREAIAQRIVDFVCEKLLEIQGDDLNNLVMKGLKLTVPKELVSDIGFDAVFVPRLARGMAIGWVPNSQDAGAEQRDSWFSDLESSVNTRIKQFIADRLQIQKGRLITDTNDFENPRILYRELTSDMLGKLCSVNCDCDGKDSFTVAISFPPGQLDHHVFSQEDFGRLIPERRPRYTKTHWREPASGATWKQPLEKAA